MELFINSLQFPAALLALCAMLLMFPLEDEKFFASALWVPFTAVIVIGLQNLHATAAHICAAIMLSLALYLALRTYIRYRHEFLYSSKKSRSIRVMCEARNLYSSVFFLFGCTFLALHENVTVWAFSIPLCALAIVLAIRIITRRPMFIRVKRRPSEASVLYDISLRENTLKSLYEKAMSYIEDKKAYANGALLQPELAKALGVTCRDISRAFSLYSEDNYRGSIKKLRVEYAADLMKRDPFMKVTEAGSMSGFQSESAFTSSFKDIIGMTPSEYMRHERYRLKRASKSSKPFQDGGTGAVISS